MEPRGNTDVARWMLWTIVIVGAVCSLVVAYRLCTMSVVLGSEEGRWTYVYLQGFQPRFLRVFLQAFLICAVFVAVPFRLVRASAWWAILVWFVVGTFVQGLIRQETRYTFEQIFVSDGANSFYSPTLAHGATTLLRDFARLRPDFPTHAQSNMPGKLLLVSGLRQISERPAVIAWLVVLLSNAGACLMYLFVRDLSGSRTVAYVSSIFYLFVPSKLFFFPVLNTVTPVLVLAAACLWQRSLQTGRKAYAAGFGVALYVLTLFDPLGLVMGLLFVALAASELKRFAQPWRALFRLSGTAAIFFGASYLALFAVFRFDLLTTFRAVATDAASFNVTAHRPYAVWVWQNPLDFLFGIGLCQAVAACAAIVWALYRGATTGFTDPFVVFCLALAGVLVATDLIGVNRGEVIRLWIFLACFFQIPAAYVCAKLNSRVAVMIVLATTLLQDVLGTAMFNFAQP